VQQYLKAQAMDVDETNATLMTSNDDLMKGKALFINNCTVCHKEDGRGEAGPNLTDDYWIYGGDIKDIFKVIKKGAPNGMPEHQSKFNPIQIQQVASYVMNLEYVSPAQGGKTPEGDLHQLVTEEPIILEDTSLPMDTLEVKSNK
jgi:cytochrome c oxidase cbb3-type subunit 3